MIKSLFGEDEEAPPSRESGETAQRGDSEKNERASAENESGSGETRQRVARAEGADASEANIRAGKEIETEDEFESIDEIRTAIETGSMPAKDSVKPFEINHPIGQPEYEKRERKPPEEPAKSPRELELEKKLAEIEAELLAEKEYQSREILSEEKIEKTPNPGGQSAAAPGFENPKFFAGEPAKSAPAEFIPESNAARASEKVSVTSKDFQPESRAETLRKSGLAWSAAIALFGSIVFMMILGWFADTFLDSSPWGITTGILIGAIVGFVQFFRMTSQIFSQKPSEFEQVSLSRNLASVEAETIPEPAEKTAPPAKPSIAAVESAENSRKTEPDEDILEIK